MVIIGMAHRTATPVPPDEIGDRRGKRLDKYLSNLVCPFVPLLSSVQMHVDSRALLYLASISLHLSLFNQTDLASVVKLELE